MILRQAYGIVSAAIVSFAVCFCVSCTRVDYSEVPDNNTSSLTFDFEWPESLPQENRPQKTTVMMTKIKNIIKHYLWSADSQGVLVEEEQSPNTVLNGSYHIAGFGFNVEGEYIVSDIDAFAQTDQMSMKDICVKIPELTADEIDSLDILNFNPGVPYVKNVSPLYFVRS